MIYNKHQHISKNQINQSSKNFTDFNQKMQIFLLELDQKQSKEINEND
jgi:hypothetical protein